MMGQLRHALTIDLPEKRTVGSRDLDQLAENLAAKFVEIGLRPSQFSQMPNRMTDLFLNLLSGVLVLSLRS